MPAVDTSTELVSLWLRREREAAGLTQEELAARSGLSVRAISNLERGRSRRPYPHSLRTIVKALGLPEAVANDLVTRSRSGQASVVAGAGLPSSVVVPRQLPPPAAQFVGRAAELDALEAMTQQSVDGGEPAEPMVVISAIAGSAGVGKTALAVYWAHKVAERFPDGQLYINLRGFDPAGGPVPPTEALRCVLDALGVPADRVPSTVDQCQNLYRSLVARRRVLVLIDNARDPAQVRPLLPGSPGSMVLITSRNELTGLIAADGARSLTLDMLSEAEAHELLVARLGEQRLDAEPAAVAELIALCARLPLALTIAAARAAVRPHFTIAALAAELRETSNRLDALASGEDATDARAAFSWSYHQLAGPAARMFEQLGLHPGPDITAAAATSLAGLTPPVARRLLHELTGSHLLAEHVPGRYALHDLLRVYATEEAHSGNTGEANREAIGRVLDHYLHTAHTAARLLSPSRPQIAPAPPRAGVVPEELASHRQALAWFEAERPVLLASTTLAATAGFDVHAWQLPWVMADFLDRYGYWHDSVAVQRTALEAATRVGDIFGQAAAGRALGKAYAWLTDYRQASARLADSLRRYEQISDRHGQARVQQSLMWVAERQGRFGDALDHAERALALFRAIAHRAGEAEALNAIGWCQLGLGDPVRARESCQQALVLIQEYGNRRHEALTWDSLGHVEHRLGHFAEATDCYQRALELFRDVDDRFYQALVLTHMGDNWHAAGETQKSSQAWRLALDILDELNHPDADNLRTKLAEGTDRAE